MLKQFDKKYVTVLTGIIKERKVIQKGKLI